MDIETPPAARLWSATSKLRSVDYPFSAYASILYLSLFALLGYDLILYLIVGRLRDSHV